MKNLIASFAILVAMTATAQAQETDLETVDENSDGKVTVAEFKEYAEGRLQGFDQLDEFAKKVDADGDGEISEDEFSGRMEILQGMLQGAQEDEGEAKPDKSSDKKKKTDKTVVEAYKKLAEHVGKSDWKEVAKRMTQKAQDEFASTQFMKAKAFLSTELPMQMEGMDDMIENLEDVFEKYDLNSLDADFEEMFKVEVLGADSQDDEEDKDDKEKKEDEKEESKKGDRKASPDEKQKELQKSILKFLDKDGKRWNIVGDLWKAQKDSPFQLSHLNGTVKEHEVEKDNAFIRIAIKFPRQDEMPNVQFQSPPIWIKMKKVKDDWKFDGMDQARTQKAMGEFRKKMGGQRFAPGNAEDDF